MNIIYINGKPSNLTNIFEMVNPSRPDLWHTVTSEEVGRPIKDILKEWADTHATYYYLKDEKITFKLEKRGE